MKTHFGFISNEGDYETPIDICERTVCGCTGEKATDNATMDWSIVNCKNCLKLKQRVIDGMEADDKEIARQMGDMVDFWESAYKLEHALTIQDT